MMNELSRGLVGGGCAAPTPSSPRPSFLAVMLLTVFGLAGINVRAQTYLQNAGMPTFTTSLPIQNGFINVANGTLHLSVPFGRYPQRGNVKADFMFTYDSNLWLNTTGSWQPDNIPTQNGQFRSEGGWRLLSQVYGGSVTST